jgi:hypothetical protein
MSEGKWPEIVVARIPGRAVYISADPGWSKENGREVETYRPASQLEQVERERDTKDEKWCEAERLCGVACEERNEAEGETKEARTALRELVGQMAETLGSVERLGAKLHDASDAERACATAEQYITKVTDEGRAALSKARALLGEKK